MDKDFLNKIARGQILVLNATYEPINITTWKRAFVLLLKEKAQIVNHRVIRLLEYIKIPFTKLKNNKPTRSAIYQRDGHKCQYCGSTRKLTIDHIIPKSKGGADDWDNLVFACSTCHYKKANKYLGQTGMRLVRRPVQPRTHLDIAISQTNMTEWHEFCFLV